MTLPVEEFLDRLLEHVSVTALHMVRAYGLYGAHERQALERCHSHLQPRRIQPPAAAPAEPERCPRCGAPLTVIVSRAAFLPSPRGRGSGLDCGVKKRPC